MRFVTAALLCCCLATGAVLAADEHPLGLNPNHPYGLLSSAYETPHVRWARPYAGGAIRALVMAPVWSQRETVELAQRLSLDYTAWMSENFLQMTAEAASDPAFGFFQPPPAVVHQALRDALARDHDVTVVGKLEWAMLPGEQRLQLLEQVSAGAGLVYVNPPPGNRELEIVFGGNAAPEGRDFITSAVPLKALPALADKSPEQLVRTSMFGQGRVVLLAYGDTPPETWAEGWPCLTPQWGGPVKAYSDEYHKPTGYVPPDDCAEMEFVPYEYYQSLVARAVLWASGRNTAARVRGLTLPPVVDYPAANHTAQVATASGPLGAVVKAAVRSRHHRDRVVELPPRPAELQTAVRLPEVPSGEYFLDAWLLTRDGAVLDWSSAAFTVRADLDISGLTVAGHSYDPGDAVAGEVLLSRPLAAGEALRVELWDNHERKIEEQPVPGGGAPHAFSFVVAQPLTIMHTIRARIIRQGRSVCERRLSFPVRARRWDRFSEITWSSAGNQVITHLMLRKLSEHDRSDAIDVGFSGATHARNIAAANLAALPYTTGFGHFGDYEGNTVPTLTGDRAMHGCMTNPATFRGIDDWFDTQGSIYGPYGPLAWSHGDESFYGTSPDVCWSDTCLAALRDYLHGVYPDLASLNREWGTSYTGWEQVQPITYEEARETRNFAPWLEHRLSAARVWARHYGRTQEALARHDPGARAGFDGPQSLPNPNGGTNWWLLKDHAGILQDYLYNSESMEIFRSFATPRHLSGMWYGTYGLTWQIGPNTVECHHFFPWYSVFHGLNSTWMWTMGAPGPLSGYAPDLTNLPFYEASRQSLREIQSGIFALLRTADRAHDGIAIHYSQASHIADSLYSDTTRSTGWMEALADANRALEDAGLQYEYVADEQIEQGALTEGKFRVLIMPHSRAVSDKEAEAIRRFVGDGGVLIADLLPGTLNGHGSRQERSMLADLFPRGEPGLVTTAGKGKAVLLGDRLSGYGYAAYRNLQGWRKLGLRSRLLSELLEQHAGLQPQVRVTPRQVGQMPPTEIVRFVTGATEFVGLLRNYFLYDNAAYDVTIHFPERSHVYNVRTGEYLGFRDSVNTELSYEAHLYARLPYQVTALALNLSPPARGAPTVVTMALQVSSGKPGAGHVLDLRVLGPGGQDLPWYRQQVPAAGGVARAAIPWALNEAPGGYTVVVRDVASGVMARREVVLR
jgi:hypothetical protein